MKPGSLLRSVLDPLRKPLATRPLIRRKDARRIAIALQGDRKANSVPDAIYHGSPDVSLDVVDRAVDIVFSVRFIENTPDLIRNLNEVARMLTDEGLYFLVVPVKNFAFDYFKPMSTIEDIVPAHLAPGAAEFSFSRSVIQERLRRTHNTAGKHWLNDHGVPSNDFGAASNFLSRYNNPKGDAVFEAAFAAGSSTKTRLSTSSIPCTPWD